MNAVQKHSSSAGSTSIDAKSLPEANLSLNEMLRVMDVAREMRNDREMAERVLARGDARAALREKLKRSAEISGDRVTEAEIDAAIDTYFADRHRYEEPKFSLDLLIAHLWVRRGVVLSLFAGCLILVGTVWGLFLSPFAPLSPTRNAERAAATAQAETAQLVEQIRTASLAPDAVAKAERLAAEIKAAGSRDPTTAIAAQETLRQLHQTLLESYQLRIARDSDGANLVVTGFRSENGDQVSGRFVLVEAVDTSGNVLTRSIRNAENGQTKNVKIWGERIPEDVFERLKTDKQADQILDETEFGIKERGRQDLQVIMQDSSGQPLQRSIQITDW